MSVTINELPSGKVSVKVNEKTPEVEIRTVKETVEHVGAVREKKVIVSDAANFAPAGPPGPPGPPGPAGSGEMLLEMHINSATPHPAYDVDMPTLNLLFENGLV